MVVGAVDFVLARPSDGVLILLVVIAAFELTDDVTLLTALLELKVDRKHTLMRSLVKRPTFLSDFGDATETERKRGEKNRKAKGTNSNQSMAMVVWVRSINNKRVRIQMDNRQLTSQTLPAFL